MHERQSVVLIEALTRVWSRIRVHHPGVPGVMLLAAPSQRGDLSVLGHFAPLRWRHKTRGDTGYHEVVVVAEHLDRSAADIVETLIHEAAHALNFERKVHDCSRSQYHNREFKAAAEELGLAVEQVPHYGFALTTLREDTRQRYDEDIKRIRPADRIWKEGGARCRVVCGGTLWERKQRKQHLSRCVEARRG